MIQAIAQGKVYNTEIPDLLVTTEVGKLQQKEIEEARTYPENLNLNQFCR